MGWWGGGGVMYFCSFIKSEGIKIAEYLTFILNI